LFDPEIEKTAKANQKAVWLACSADPCIQTQHTKQIIFEPETITAPVIKTGDANPPPITTLVNNKTFKAASH